MNTFHILGTMQSALKTPFIQSQKSRRLMVISSLSKQGVRDSERLSDLPEITKLVSGSSGTWNRMSWLHHFCTLLLPDQAVHSWGPSWQDASILQWRPCIAVIPSVWRCRCTSFVTEHLTAWRETGKHVSRNVYAASPKEWRIYLLLYLFNFLWMCFIFFTSEAIFIMLGESFFCSHSFWLTCLPKCWVSCKPHFKGWSSVTSSPTLRPPQCPVVPTLTLMMLITLTYLYPQHPAPTLSFWRAGAVPDSMSPWSDMDSGSK